MVVSSVIDKSVFYTPLAGLHSFVKWFEDFLRLQTAAAIGQDGGRREEGGGLLRHCRLAGEGEDAASG